MEAICKSDVEKLLQVVRDDKDLCTKLRIHFEDILDEDYRPPLRVKKDPLSEDEGSVGSEDEYEVGWTSEGHCYLK
jgi:hypothetical protein